MNLDQAYRPDASSAQRCESVKPQDAVLDITIVRAPLFPIWQRLRENFLGDDIGFPDNCCQNDRYCYVNTAGQPSCCALGSNCDNVCTGNRYLCTTTATVAGAVVSTSACCPRSCSATDVYLCASSLGGRCCGLGFSCGTSACVSTDVPPTTLVPIVPSGCTTGQFSCAASIGGGCCYSGATCTVTDSTLVCASGTTGPSAIKTG